MPLTIAIDGPVGAGKSTISDEVAKRLGILHLDTGAMYRAIGLAALESGVDPKNEQAVTALLESGNVQVDVRYENNAQITLLNGRDVSSLIRTQEAGSAASAVSRYVPVRSLMVKRQQEMAAQQPMLLDGRDIGTVVLPNATAKIFLTASPEARAQRRLEQLAKKENAGPLPSFEDVLSEVNARDLQDTTRDLTPLRKAEDAVLVDTTHMDFEQSVQAIIDIVEARHG